MIEDKQKYSVYAEIYASNGFKYAIATIKTSAVERHMASVFDKNTALDIVWTKCRK